MNKKIQITSCIKHKEITISYLDINQYLILKIFTQEKHTPIYKKIIVNKTGRECIDLMALRKKKFLIELKGASYKETKEVIF